MSSGGGCDTHHHMCIAHAMSVCLLFTKNSDDGSSRISAFLLRSTILF